MLSSPFKPGFPTEKIEILAVWVRRALVDLLVRAVVHRIRFRQVSSGKCIPISEVLVHLHWKRVDSRAQFLRRHLFFPPSVDTEWPYLS